MAATFTERYISATVASLPPALQADVRTELQASVEDAIETRVEQGEDRAEAERAVLTDLGDPAALAAGYADRPLHLIGPRYYLAWWRLLKLLGIMVPVVAMVGVAIGQMIAGGDIGEVIGAAAVAGVGAIVHVAFWVTLVFFILERIGSDTTITQWNVDMLPEPSERGVGRSELIGTVVFLLLGAGAVLWDHFRGFFPTGGEPIPVLHPDLWPWWITGLFALMGAEAVLAVYVYGRGRWTRTAAAVNTALAVLVAAPAVVLLATGQLVNPEFLAVVSAAGGEGFAAGDAQSAMQGGTFRILAVITGAFIIGIAVWDVVDGWLKTRRADRAA